MSCCVNAISKAFLCIDASSNLGRMLYALFCSNYSEFALMAESDNEQLHSVLSTSTLSCDYVGKIWHFCLCLCASYLEIYNERVHDLLQKKPANRDGVLRVREHPLDGPYVESKMRWCFSV